MTKSTNGGKLESKQGLSLICPQNQQITVCEALQSQHHFWFAFQNSHNNENLFACAFTNAICWHTLGGCCDAHGNPNVVTDRHFANLPTAARESESLITRQ